MIGQSRPGIATQRILIEDLACFNQEYASLLKSLENEIYQGKLHQSQFWEKKVDITVPPRSATVQPLDLYDVFTHTVKEVTTQVEYDNSGLFSAASPVVRGTGKRLHVKHQGCSNHDSTSLNLSKDQRTNTLPRATPEKLLTEHLGHYYILVRSLIDEINDSKYKINSNSRSRVVDLVSAI